MKVVVTGATGLIGLPLSEALVRGGHELVAVSREPLRARQRLPDGARAVGWQGGGPDEGWKSEVASADVVFHLAGESVGGRRWSPAQKETLRASRVDTGRAVAEAIAGASPRPSLLVSASAIGYYGSDLSDRVRAESSPPGDDFFSRMAVDWEAAADPARAAGVRVVHPRIGIVLSPESGYLAGVLPFFRAFVGGPIGSGRQYVSWIHRDDLVALLLWALTEKRAEGPINATAPEPATNREFAAALGRALGRPSWLPAPAFAVRLALGEFGRYAATGQRVVPEKAQRLGFTFRFPQLGPALAELLRGEKAA